MILLVTRDGATRVIRYSDLERDGRPPPDIHIPLPQKPRGFIARDDHEVKSGLFDWPEARIYRLAGEVYCHQTCQTIHIYEEQ